MIHIRRGVFETNSSSVHAIVVSTKQEELNTNQTVNFGLEHFGWYHPALTEIDELATYFYTAACDYYDKDMQSEIRKLLPQDTDAHFAVPKFEEFEAYDHRKHKYLKNGHIDHIDELKDWLEEMFSDKDAFIHFLFSNYTYIIVSNDNEPSEELKDLKEKKYLNDNDNVYIKGN